MVNVKATAAVLATSMSLFSAIPASAATRHDHLQPKKVTTGSSPIGGGSSSTGSSNGGSGAPTNNGGTTNNGGSGTTTSPNGGSNNGGSSNSGSGTSIGGNGSIGGSGVGSSGSPISSGNRPTGSTGNNSPRPGPRAPVEQPGDNGGRGPFSENGNNAPRTMDGTEGTGFNFGNILSGFNSLTSTLFQLVATFGMLKQIFGWFGKKDNPADGVKEVAAVADKGTNVGRDASTKTDEKLERERARAAGEDTGGAAADTDEAEGAGMREQRL